MECRPPVYLLLSQFSLLERQLVFALVESIQIFLSRHLVFHQVFLIALAGVVAFGAVVAVVYVDSDVAAAAVVFVAHGHDEFYDDIVAVDTVEELGSAVVEAVDSVDSVVAVVDFLICLYRTADMLMLYCCHDHSNQLNLSI